MGNGFHSLYWREKLPWILLLASAAPIHLSLLIQVLPKICLSFLNLLSLPPIPSLMIYTIYSQPPLLPLLLPHRLLHHHRRRLAPVILPQPSKVVQGPQKQSTAKRGRSSSPPTLIGRKSFKTELSSAVLTTYRKLSTPPTHWRSTNALTQWQKRAVGMSGNSVPLQLAVTKEKHLCSSPCDSSDRQVSGVEKRREACMHQIHQKQSQMGQNGSREVFSEESSRIAHMEDLNNPLMYMDCFIFL